MANYECIAAAGLSLERFLNRRFDELEPIASGNTTALLARTNDLDDLAGGRGTLPALSIYLYRVDFNRAVRASWSAQGHIDGRSHLPLDLHFLLTAWAENAGDEHRILGRAMQSLESTPILSGPYLDPSGEWAAGDALQIVLEEITTEAVMRTFDSLPADYRLSVPYVMRIVRIDGDRDRSEPPVTTLVTGILPELP